MTFTRYARVSLLSATAVCLAALSQGALAQQDEPTTPPPSASPSAATAPIEDAKIEKFADAFVAVQDIQSKASQKLQSTTDPAQQQQVKSTAESEMIQAVRQNGLQVEEFNQIVQTMAADAELRTRITAKIQQRTKG